MAYILGERSKAKDYKVKAGDTLESIALEKCPDPGWKSLALFNWGTIDSTELLRALAETIGVKASDLADSSIKGEQIFLEPDSDLNTTIKIPEIWKKEGLALSKKYKLKAKKITPANAISIEELDKWFIPEYEKCELKYNTEGLKEFSDSLKIDIFGSNYCECNDWNKGLGKYSSPASLVDESLFFSDLEAKERKSGEFRWAGDTTTKKGILGRKTGSASKRHINVAFSPYTAHLRYWKSDTDKDAHLILEPFWPQWNEVESKPAVTSDFSTSPAGITWNNTVEQDSGFLEIYDNEGQRVYFQRLSKAKLASGAQQVSWNKRYNDEMFNGKFKPTYIDDSAEVLPLKKLLFKSTPYVAKIRTFKNKMDNRSLKINWELKKTSSKLKRGLVKIVDASNKLVFIKPLPEAKLADGKHEIIWDGKYASDIKNSKNGNIAIVEDMPYRLKIEMNAGINQAEGLAIAAMHSEVRLHVHKTNYHSSDVRYSAAYAKPSLALSKALYVPGTEPAEGSGTKWFRHKLNQYGFHPGPVTDNGAADNVYKISLKEFKRSVPADGRVVAPNFTRLALAAVNAPEVENNETVTAIKTIRDSDKRSLFGDLTAILANDNEPDLTDEQFSEKLSRPDEDIVLWVDDRQYNTSSSAKDENNQPFLTGSPEREAFGLKNYRGEMAVADARTDLDAQAIARPWIPVQVDFALLGREDKLYPDYSRASVFTVDNKKRDAMRMAIGPLRVDWTFDELPIDLSTVDVSAYDTQFTRTRKYMGWALYNNKATYTRKDTKRKTIYTNCKDTLGGIRPADLTKYHAGAFGQKELSLEPWYAQSDTATESIATVVHEHLSASQTEDTDLFEKTSLGRAAVYFNPSIIAGDGYRIRAEVNFEKFSGYEFPNIEQLKARYPIAPTATSARMRIWRRSSIRGFMCWGVDRGHWPGYIDSMREHYKAAHTYFIYEGSSVPRRFAVTDVFDPANNTHQTIYKNIIKNNTTSPLLSNTARMELRADDIWPWGHRDDMGKEWISNEGILNPRMLYKKWLNGGVISPTWREFRTGLLLALVKQFEKQGVLRGHTLIEFDASPPVKLLKYTCNGHTTHTYWKLIKEGTPHPPAGKCPDFGCRTGPSLADPLSTLSDTGSSKRYANGLPLPAVGIALGATWLFTTGVSPETWAHELGHHRHLEHASDAPGSQYHLGSRRPNTELHDSESNSIPNWATVGGVAATHRWDKQCIMSYEYNTLYFCGKCQLRNRGWKVQALGYPGPDIQEP